MEDQPSRLSFDEMAYYLSGYLAGNQAGYQQAQDDMAARWSHVAHIVHAHARLEPHTAHERKVHIRRVVAAARNQSEAQPWSDESPP